MANNNNTTPQNQGGNYVPPKGQNNQVPPQGGNYVPPGGQNNQVPPQGGNYVPPKGQNNQVPPQGNNYVPPKGQNNQVPPKGNNYVPPKGQNNQVPPQGGNYVPPKGQNNQVPPQGGNYVPPKGQKNSQANFGNPGPKNSQANFGNPGPKNSQANFGNPGQYSNPNSQNNYGNNQQSNHQRFTPQANPVNKEKKGFLKGYFDTPKVNITFYLSVYFFFILYIVYGEVSSAKGFGGMLQAIIGGAILFLSNYTYCWYADYKRYTGGSFSWFFNKLSGAKFSTSAIMSNGPMYKTTMRKTWTGSWTGTSRPSYSATFFAVFIWSIIVEFVKLIIVIPIALVTIFTHKTTIREYKKILKRDGVIN